MSKTKLFAKHSAIYFLGNLVNAGISFLTLPILTRLLSPGDYGTVNLFLVYTTVASNIICLGSYVPISAKFHTTELTKFRSFFSAALFVSFLLTIILLGWAVIVGLKGRSLLGLTFGYGAPLIAISALAQSIIVLFQTLYQAKQKPTKYAMVQVSLSGLGILLTFCFLPLTHIPWMARVLGIVTVQIFLACLGVRYFYRTDLLTLNFRKSDLREVLTSGSPVVPHNLGLNLLNQFDQYMVMRFAGASTLGCYGLGGQVAGIVESAGTAFSRAFTAHVCISLKNSKQFKDLLQLCKSAMLGFLGLLTLSGVILVIQNPLLKFFATPSYQSAKVFIPILCVRGLFQSLQYLFGAFAIAFEVSWVLGLAAIISGIWTVFAASWLAPKYMAIGIAYASMTGAFINFLVTAIVVLWILRRSGLLDPTR